MASTCVWLQEASSEAGDEKKGLQQFRRLKKEAVEAFRYRGEDVLKSLTRRAVRDARARDLKLEILNCSKLQVLHAHASFLIHEPHIPYHACEVSCLCIYNMHQ
jgi:hypothetical protein